MLRSIVVPVGDITSLGVDDAVSQGDGGSGSALFPGSI